jgi:hypothetical protein
MFQIYGKPLDDCSVRLAAPSSGDLSNPVLLSLLNYLFFPEVTTARVVSID